MPKKPALQSTSHASAPPIDKRALDILERHGQAEMSKYVRVSVTPPTKAEIEYARSAGYFADDVEVTHDELIDRLLSARDKLTPRDVADAFVTGLGQQRCDWRSAIASYAVSMHFPTHKADRSHENLRCLVCEGGSYEQRDSDGTFTVSPNWVMRLRFTLGGGAFNHPDPNYAALDLEQFAAMSPKPTPTPEDVKALKELLDILKAQPANCTGPKAAKAIGRLGGHNNATRQQMIETLSIVGILKPAKHDTFFTRFTPYKDRPDQTNDWAFPAAKWRGKDGVNDAAVKFWFGHLLD